MRIDLHIHSIASDGQAPASEIAAEAGERRLKLWALTDHDTIDGLLSLPRPWPKGLVTGVEITADFEGAEIHIVGLGFNTLEISLRAHLEHVRAIRVRRLQIMIDFVNEKRSSDLTFAEVMAKSTVVTRAHLARALVERGIAATYRDAWSDLIGDAHIARLDLPHWPGIAETAEAIHHAGGIAILAHPGLIRDLGRIENIMRLGLDGLEANHPHLDPNLAKPLIALAKKKKWLMSAGSDSHQNPKHSSLGEWTLDLSLLNPLARRLQDNPGS